MKQPCIMFLHIALRCIHNFAYFLVAHVCVYVHPNTQTHACVPALNTKFENLSAVDVWARTPMKGAAKCDEHCELQNSVNQLDLERMLCFRDSPESSSASASALCFVVRYAVLASRVCVSG